MPCHSQPEWPSAMHKEWLWLECQAQVSVEQVKGKVLPQRAHMLRLLRGQQTTRMHAGREVT